MPEYPATGTVAHVSHTENEGGSPPPTITVTPGQIGNCLVLHVNGRSASPGVVATVAGGGVPTSGPGAWQRVTNPPLAAINTVYGNEETWIGTVAVIAAGGLPINVTYTAGGQGGTLVVEEFSSSLGISAQWSGVGGTVAGPGNAATIPYPTLPSSTAGCAYTGMDYGAGIPQLAGTSPGYTYVQTATANRSVCWNAALPPNTANAPTAAQTTSSTFSSTGAVIRASVA